MDVKEIISSGLLELYASGLASPEESKLVQQWIMQYPAVADELASIELTMEAIAFENAVQPDSAIREKLIRSINDDANPPATRIAAKVVPLYSKWRYIAAAVFALLVGSVAINILLYNRSNETGRQLLITQTRVSELENKANEMENNWKLVQSKFSQPVSLSGMDVAPDAAAKVFWMKNTGEVYIDPSNLPQAPSGKQYHLWGIVDSKPVDAGVVVMDSKGKRYAIQKMKTFGKVEAFAVSLEEAGAAVMEAPKGDIYVMGKL